MWEHLGKIKILIKQEIWNNIIYFYFLDKLFSF